MIKIDSILYVMYTTCGVLTIYYAGGLLDHVWVRDPQNRLALIIDQHWVTYSDQAACIIRSQE